MEQIQYEKSIYTNTESRDCIEAMSRPLYVLSAVDVREVTSQMGVDVILDVVFDALRAAAGKAVEMPHRTSIESTRHTTLFMPSRLGESTVIKIASVAKGASDGGLPATTVVMDEKTGVVDAVVNARSLTALRTAAGSVIATKMVVAAAGGRTLLLPSRVVLFGAGAQIQAHAALLIASFPSITECSIVNRSYNTRLDTLVDLLRVQHPHVTIIGLSGEEEAREGVERAVRGADVIVTATSSTEALFPAEWVKSGTHVNLIGSFTRRMREVDDELIRRARVLLVDSRAACAHEAGELISARIDFVAECVEVGECTRDGRGAEGGGRTGDITVYKSVGVSVMDAAIAHLVVSAAKQQGRGVYIPFDD